MPKTAWYRSLYWRIGLGFIVFLALVVAVQAGALVWLTSRVQYGPPSPSATRVIADELSAALATNSKLDIAQFFREQDERVPMVAVMRDGRVISSNGAQPPDDVLAQAKARLNSLPPPFGPPRGFGPGPDNGGGGPGGLSGGGAGPGFGSGFGPDSGGIRDRRAFGFGGPLRRGGSPMSPVFVNDRIVGLVVANPQTTWEQLGPTLLIVGFVLVAAGTTSAALLIVGPVRRRLGSLEEAARKVGSGDLTARAREDGGDEVAAVAQTFNQMTTDLAARAEQLQAADRQRRMLFADVSHELMTPLTAMRGYLETLSMSGVVLDDETRARYLSIIGDESRRMEHIVRDLLDLARLEAARDSVDKQDVPVEDLFGRVVARHEREASAKNVALTTSVAPGAEIVAGDPMRLEQALQNLAANALRHTPSGGRVGLGAELHEHEMVIVVRDTGAGIAPEHLPHVFDRFYKVDPARAGETAGSGLGLSIVKAIIERHGGTIAVRSTLGQGTEFTIRLPLGS
jgi:signal transduction histidine kinase